LSQVLDYIARWHTGGDPLVAYPGGH
jgi:hypothetical protein